jgi:glycine cleavage system transcriptional repressor
MAHFAVSALGADRPGIVAAVTGALVDQGCNLEDTSMSILGGHFAMMLIVAGGPGTTAEGLEAALESPAAEFDLIVAARPVADTVPESPVGSPFTVAVYGADRPGIVHRVTAALAARGVNIIDLTTRVIGDPGQPVYAMVLDVSVPEGADPSEVESDLAALGRDLGVDCSLHATEADVL